LRQSWASVWPESVLYTRTRKQRAGFVEIAVEWNFGHTLAVPLSYHKIPNTFWAQLKFKDRRPALATPQGIALKKIKE